MVDGCVRDGLAFLVYFLIFRPSVLVKMFCGVRELRSSENVSRFTLWSKERSRDRESSEVGVGVEGVTVL